MTQVNEQAAKRKRKKGRRMKQLPLPGFPEVKKPEGNAWDNVYAERLLSLVVAITDVGGAVILSQSPDAEVAGVMVLHDDHEKRTVWSRRGDELDERLVELIDYFIAWKDDND